MNLNTNRLNHPFCSTKRCEMEIEVFFGKEWNRYDHLPKKSYNI
jgi:hypothetical protein